MPLAASSPPAAKQLQLVMGLSGGALGTLLLVGLFVQCRRMRRRRKCAYERVCHELDAEERDFKRALETAQFDDEIEDGDGAVFNENELEQIEMIEQYRSRLVKDAES
ncbi:hypothetical protein M885DRAFT_626894 [Pelagophyceae sp. CCMP2097]|nr:hypothetical protein M885DRAFT_626894 [Pelagophyceae sp. CCMP2097]